MFTNINHFERLQFLHVFLGTPNTPHIDISDVFFKLCHFAIQFSRDLQRKQRKNEQVPAKRDHFWQFTLDD